MSGAGATTCPGVRRCSAALLTLCGGGPEAGRQTQHQTPKQGQAAPFHSRPHSWMSKTLPKILKNKCLEGGEEGRGGETWAEPARECRRGFLISCQHLLAVSRLMELMAATCRLAASPRLPPESGRAPQSPSYSSGQKARTHSSVFTPARNRLLLCPMRLN